MRCRCCSTLQEVLAPLLRRKCEQRTLAEVDEEALPLFVKPVSNDKSFDGERSTPPPLCRPCSASPALQGLRRATSCIIAYRGCTLSSPCSARVLLPCSSATWLCWLCLVSQPSRFQCLLVGGLLSGRVVSTAEDLTHLLSEAGGLPADCAVWVSEPVEFVAEHRLFVGGGKVYGVGRIRGEEEGPPQEFVDEVLG